MEIGFGGTDTSTGLSFKNAVEVLFTCRVCIRILYRSQVVDSSPEWPSDQQQAAFNPSSKNNPSPIPLARLKSSVTTTTTTEINLPNRHRI